MKSKPRKGDEERDTPMSMTITAQPANREKAIGPYKQLLPGEAGYAELRAFGALLGRINGCISDEDALAYYGPYTGDFTAEDVAQLRAENPELETAFQALLPSLRDAMTTSRYVMKISGSPETYPTPYVYLGSDELIGEPTATWSNYNADLILNSAGFRRSEDGCYDIRAAEVVKVFRTSAMLSDRHARLVEIAQYGLDTFGADARVYAA